MSRSGALRGGAGVGMLLACGFLACARGPVDASTVTAARRLEQTFLARTGAGSGGWLLVGRFELRREEYLEEGAASERDLPMTQIAWPDFVAWAAPRGLRGLTTAEWRAVAGAPPAAAAEASSLTRNTLELGIGRPLPVGVFERGRSPLGGYDFYGNVWEMCAPDAAGRVPALGGSFASREVGADARSVFLLESGDQAEDVGVRYCADAVPYLRDFVLPEWRAAPAVAAAAVRAAAARWQPGLRAALAQTLRSERLPPEFCALLEG